MDRSTPPQVGRGTYDRPAADWRRMVANAQALAKIAAQAERDPQRRAQWQLAAAALSTAQEAAQEL